MKLKRFKSVKKSTETFVRIKLYSEIDTEVKVVISIILKNGEIKQEERTKEDYLGIKD